jgi:hypothetical protein
MLNEYVGADRIDEYGLACIFWNNSGDPATTTEVANYVLMIPLRTA